MNHFTGVNPKERYDNALLNELRTTNTLLAEILRHHVQMPEKKVSIKPTARGSNNGRANRMAKG